MNDNGRAYKKVPFSRVDSAVNDLKQRFRNADAQAAQVDHQTRTQPARLSGRGKLIYQVRMRRKTVAVFRAWKTRWRPQVIWPARP